MPAYSVKNDPPNASEGPCWVGSGAGEGASVIGFIYTETENFGEVDRWGIDRDTTGTTVTAYTAEKFNSRSPASYLTAEQDRATGNPGVVGNPIIGITGQDIDYLVNWTIYNPRYPIYTDASSDLAFVSWNTVDGIDHNSVLYFADNIPDIGRTPRGRRSRRRGCFPHFDMFNSKTRIALPSGNIAHWFNQWSFVQPLDWQLSHNTDASQKALLLEEAPPAPAVGVFNLMQTGIGK